ncbi:MAG: hypothetical protein MHM6MM_000824 [Cercozoa sp. M6MM]
MSQTPPKQRNPFGVNPAVSILVDGGVCHAARAAGNLLNKENYEKLSESCAKAFDPSGKTMPMLSVRSATDLYLKCRNFPRGSRLLLTGINIPDMLRVIRSHGLWPIPVDVSIDTFQPSDEQLRHAILADVSSIDRNVSVKQSPDDGVGANAPDLRRDGVGDAVALMVSHVYGRRLDMDRIFRVVDECNAVRAQSGLPPVEVIEDAAEAFEGRFWHGDDRSLMSLFSFGAIKHAHAFGGCLVRFNDADLMQQMKRVHDKFPLQPKSTYAKKVAKYSFVSVLLQEPIISPGLATMFAMDKDLSAKFVGMVRGFPSVAAMLSGIRQRPSRALMATLRYRMRNYERKDVEHRRQLLQRFLRHLPQQGREPRCYMPGLDCFELGFWLCPLLVKSPTEFVERMKKLKVLCFVGATQLSYVPVPAELEQFSSLFPQPTSAQFLMRHVVYLPVHARMNAADVRFVAQAADYCTRQDQMEELAAQL